MTYFTDSRGHFLKFESAMQVYSIKNLMFNNKPVHHEGVMMVSEADSNNKNQPVFMFPYWDLREKKEKMLKITETHLNHLCRGPKNLLVLNLQRNLSIKRVVIVLTDIDDDGDDLEKLCMFLPENLRPCQCQVVTEIQIIEPKKRVEQLEDAPLVMQYVPFLGHCKCDINNYETSVAMFKSTLESSGPGISRFLKMTLKFKEQPSVVNMLTTYVKSHKCSVDGCPNFTKDKCGKCKTVKYCSVACQQMDYETHSANDCDKFKNLYINRVDAFNKMITEVVFAKLQNRGGKFLSFLEFTARIKPWVLSGYHDHIVKKTFLLGSLKFSSEKFSNIDIRENTQSLKPLLKYGAELFPAIRRNKMDEMAEITDRSYYFQQIVLMKKMYESGDLDVRKIKSGDWMEDLLEKDDEYMERFKDEDFATVMRWMKGANAY